MKLFALLTIINCLNYSVEPYVIIPPIEPVFSAFEEDCLSYGVEIDEGWTLLDNGTNPLTFKHTTNTRTDRDHLQYQTDIYHVILKYAETNVYAYLCRMVVNPVSKSRDWGFLGINSHSDNWYFRDITISIDLPQISPEFVIGEWSPMNEPNEYESNFTVSVGYNALGISVSFTKVESLDVISRTNPASNHFETEYHYNPLDEYSHNSIVYYTAFRFTLPTELDIEDFPIVNFSTTYFGHEYFGAETKNFISYVYVQEIVLPPIIEL